MKFITSLLLLHNVNTTSERVNKNGVRFSNFYQYPSLLSKFFL
jgi:hypothetical protein